MDRRLHNTIWLLRTPSTSRITIISRMFNNTLRSNKEKGLERINLYGLVISITGWTKIIYIPALFPLARLLLSRLFAISRLVYLRAMDLWNFLHTPQLRKFYRTMVAF
uniref:Uncharacterized protein n=1 Tax=Salix viminalis TaxID=40686 RepID=A0A6N2MIQ8_SALVM